MCPIPRIPRQPGRRGLAGQFTRGHHSRRERSHRPAPARSHGDAAPAPHDDPAAAAAAHHAARLSARQWSGQTLTRPARVIDARPYS